MEMIHVILSNQHYETCTDTHIIGIASPAKPRTAKTENISLKMYECTCLLVAFCEGGRELQIRGGIEEKSKSISYFSMKTYDVTSY